MPRPATSGTSRACQQIVDPGYQRHRSDSPRWMINRLRRTLADPPFGAGADMWRDTRWTGQMEHSGILRERGFIVPYLEMRSLPQVTVTRRATIMIRRFPAT
jgi:hypothetical protein